ncbi:hypothetical protein CROQUDRAFT_663095 [Cronartium quercuum f. sp. fusiforme G11]|uniref:Armadillo-like helical domain-containing protein n=1 Tax=Cronartium quercuum f. sp. fusiforme G11 TaxID=708437 RepID=A0A9P6N8Q5_9BASI|nr:hypothetical protein CROQUDRAFT_663095 [Cronartium quercuum f. sp. fusiforme G11]
MSTPASVPLYQSSSSLTPASNRTLKWYASIDRILSQTDDPLAEAVEDRERFYLDLFCLKIDSAALAAKLDEIPVEALLTTYQRNLADLFEYAVQCLKPSDDEEMDKIRLPNVIATLSIVCRQVLKKKGFENFNMDIINLFAGSLDKSDQLFSDLVAGIDHILASLNQDLEIRHRTLQLALSIVSAVNQGSINAYFLRRDLFNTIATIISDPQTVSLTFDAVLLLGLLANFRRFETRNPYSVRMEDYVDEKAMERIITLSVIALGDVRLGYMKAQDETPSSLIGSVLGALSLIKTSAAAPPPSEPFRTHPIRPTCILLPLFEFLRANTTFLNVVIADDEFWAEFLSFGSYLSSHASASKRARTYARLMLVMLIVLVEEGGLVLSQKQRTVSVKFCRQRQPQLPLTSDQPRPPISSILDLTILFLRHNLRRELEIESYLACLRLVHSVLVNLQAHQVRLDYDWTGLWRALVCVGSLVGGRGEELKQCENIDKVAQQILDIFSFAVIWAESLFVDTNGIAGLYYEILRAEHTVKQLLKTGGVSQSEWDQGKGSSAMAGTIEGGKNLEMILKKFGSLMSTRTRWEADQVVELVRNNLGLIEFVDTCSLEARTRRFTDSEHEKVLKSVTEVAVEDVFQLMV